MFDCGVCGYKTCREYADAGNEDCPISKVAITADGEPSTVASLVDAALPVKDVYGRDCDFVLAPLPGEISARKIVVPFRADLVEKWEIIPGDIVMGRPHNAGCPIPHVIEVISANPTNGEIVGWVVGPAYSRDKTVKDVVSYHMMGFEGIATQIHKQPELGKRVHFLPMGCMMGIFHTGVTNLLHETEDGLKVRLEGIVIL